MGHGRNVESPRQLGKEKRIHILKYFVDVSSEEICKDLTNFKDNQSESYDESILRERIVTLKAQLFKWLEDIAKPRNLSPAVLSRLFNNAFSLVLFKILLLLRNGPLSYETLLASVFSKCFPIKDSQSDLIILNNKLEEIESEADRIVDSGCKDMKCYEFLTGYNTSNDNDMRLKQYLYLWLVTVQFETNNYLISVTNSSNVHKLFVIRPVGESCKCYRLMTMSKKLSYIAYLMNDKALSKRNLEASISFLRGAVSLQNGSPLSVSKYFILSGNCFRRVAETTASTTVVSSKNDTNASFASILRKAALRYSKAAESIQHDCFETGKRSFEVAEYLKKSAFAALADQVNVSRYYLEAGLKKAQIDDAIMNQNLNVAIWNTKSSNYYLKAAETEEKDDREIAKLWESCAIAAANVAWAYKEKKINIAKLSITTSICYKKAIDARLSGSELIEKYWITSADNFTRCADSIDDGATITAVLYMEAGCAIKKAAEYETNDSKSGLSKYWERAGNSYIRAAKSSITPNEEITALYVSAGTYYKRAGDACSDNRKLVAKYWDRAGTSCIRGIKSKEADKTEKYLRFQEASECYRKAAESLINSNEDAASYWNQAGDSAVRSVVSPRRMELTEYIDVKPSSLSPRSDEYSANNVPW